MHHRTDYDFDVISGPSTKEPVLPARPPAPRPVGAAAPVAPRPAAEAERGDEA